MSRHGPKTTFGPGRQAGERSTAYGPRPELAPGTTRKATDEPTLTAMGIGRPAKDTELGVMKPRLVHVDDPLWDAVKAAAASEGVSAAELVRRALRADTLICSFFDR